jgi:hypothetical protein
MKCKENYSYDHAVRHSGAGETCRASRIPNFSDYLFPMYLQLKHKYNKKLKKKEKKCSYGDY